jgi:hypothetical protein
MTAVQRDNVPLPEVAGVAALIGIAGGRAVLVDDVYEGENGGGGHVIDKLGGDPPRRRSFRSWLCPPVV